MSGPVIAQEIIAWVALGGTRTENHDEWRHAAGRYLA